MPSQPAKRAPLPAGRRIPITVTVDVDTLQALSEIGRGNRSAAIELLVRDYLETQPGTPVPFPATP